MIRNPEIQFASADAIAAFQEERLREEVAYLYENSPYYRRMFDGCGMQPGQHILQMPARMSMGSVAASIAATNSRVRCVTGKWAHP